MNDDKGKIDAKQKMSPSVTVSPMKRNGEAFTTQKQLTDAKGRESHRLNSLDNANDEDVNKDRDCLFASKDSKTFHKSLSVPFKMKQLKVWAVHDGKKHCAHSKCEIGMQSQWMRNHC